MKKRICTTALVLVLSGILAHLVSQPSPIGLGWAQNSVNVPIFRKNSVVSFNGLQYTAYYDSTGSVILAKREIGSDTWEVHKTQHTGDITDAHCSISIAVDGNGHLHMAWDHHNDNLRYCISVDSLTLEMGEKVSMIGSLENDVTYPEFFRMPNGDLIFMYRYGVSGSGNLVINKYIVAEKRWERLHDVLIDGQNQRNAYWQSCVDKEGTIHISWVWRETWDVATNHDLCYAKSIDGGVTWTKSTGEAYTIPIILETSEYACIIPQNSELINQTSMYADAHGRPYIASYWMPTGSAIPQYHLVYQDSAKWKTMPITNRQTAFSLSGGGTKKIPISRPQLVVDDRNDSIVVYLIYRDIERESKVSVNRSIDLDNNRWAVYDLTDSSVNSWEPSYDTELWKDSAILNIFVQKAGQGDGETLEDIPPQPVYILGMESTLLPVDTITIHPGDNTAIKEGLPRNSKLSLHPNPAKEEIIISGDYHNVEVSIYSSKGNILYTNYINHLPVNVNVQYLPKGLYFVHLSGKETFNTSRFIIQ